MEITFRAKLRFNICCLWRAGGEDIAKLTDLKQCAERCPTSGWDLRNWRIMLALNVDMVLQGVLVRVAPIWGSILSVNFRTVGWFAVSADLKIPTHTT